MIQEMLPTHMVRNDNAAGDKVRSDRHCYDAQVRRLNDRAILDIGDIQEFSALLCQEYPALIYSFSHYKTGFPTPSTFQDDVPIILFSDLEKAVLTALKIEADGSSNNSPDFNRPDIFCRLPWSAEVASENPVKLIGGREFPDDFFELACQHRALGRWFALRYKTNGYLHPRIPTARQAEWVLDKVKLPDQDYMPFEMLDASQSEFVTSYDLSDPETAAFAKHIHTLWRRLHTTKIAHYDPIKGEVVHPENWDGKYAWKIGKQALAGAIAHPKRYAGFAPRTAQDGGRLLLGPVPKKAKRNTR